MKPRAISTSVLLSRSVREIIAPLAPDLWRVNAEAAMLAAAPLRPQLTEVESRNRLHRVSELQTTLSRLERQLQAALIGQPSEIAEHDRIRDLRAAMAAIHARLVGLGA
jgi:hypothetical protein